MDIRQSINMALSRVALWPPGGFYVAIHSTRVVMTPWYKNKENLMKKTWKIIVLVLVLAAFLLTGCSGIPLGTNWPGLAGSGGSVYLSDSNNVYAIQSNNGTLMWKFPQESLRVSFFAPVATVDETQIIVGDYTRTLYSINPKSGATNWTFTLAEGRYIGAALVTQDTIYVPNADYSLYALNLDGTLKWKFTTGQAVWAAPVTDGELIYFNSLDHYAYALSPDDGSLVWKTDLQGPSVGAPALDGGRLYIGMLDNGLDALDTSNGKLLWETATEDGIYGTPIYQDGKVFTADLSGTIYGIDAVNGNIVWQIKPGGPIASSPVVFENGLIFTTELGQVVAVDLAGEVLWTRPVTGTLNSSPVVANGVIVVAAFQGDNLLTAFDSTGTQVWSFNPPKK